VTADRLGAGSGWRNYATPESVPVVLDATDRNRAIVEMIGTGAFTDTPALARWAETAEAQPILRGFLLARIKPAETEYFAVDFVAALDQIDAQDALAADIEARFGQ
jgi:hypothetical protein